MFYLEKRHKGIGRSRQLIKWTTYGFIQRWFEKRLETTFDSCLNCTLVSKADLQRLVVDCLDVLEDEKKAKELFSIEDKHVLSFMGEVNRTSRKLQAIIESEVNWSEEECLVYRC